MGAHQLLTDLAKKSAALAEVEAELQAAGSVVPLGLGRRRDLARHDRDRAFGAWWAAEAGRLRGLLAGRLRGLRARADVAVDDLLQQVVSRVSERAGGYTGADDTGAKAWAGAIAVNAATDALRKDSRVSKHLAAEPLGLEDEGGPWLDRAPDPGPRGEALLDQAQLLPLVAPAVDHCEDHACALIKTNEPGELRAKASAPLMGGTPEVARRNIRAFRLLRMMEVSPSEAIAELQPTSGALSPTSLDRLAGRGRAGLRLGQARAVHPSAPLPDPPSREVGRVVELLDFDALHHTAKIRRAGSSPS
jgi:DNA-directed RNA polymerase specialized sigma24 family protein